MIRLGLALLFSLSALGCSTPQPTEGFIVSPDSVRFTERGKDSPTALLWYSNRRIANLWLAGRSLGGCTIPPSSARYACVYSGPIPDNFIFGDTLRLALVDTAASNCTVLSGSGWIVQVTPDSLTGLVQVQTSEPCGSRSESVALSLARQN